MAHLVPHSRQNNDSNQYQNGSNRPTSAYSPAPPRINSPAHAPHIPQRPTSEYVPPPIYPSSYSSSLPNARPYSQPPTDQFGGLSLGSDASRYSNEYRRNVESGNGGSRPPEWDRSQTQLQDAHHQPRADSGSRHTEYRPGNASVGQSVSDLGDGGILGLD